MRMFARRVLQGLGSVLALAAPGLGSRSASPAEWLELAFGLPGGVYDPLSSMRSPASSLWIARGGTLR